MNKLYGITTASLHNNTNLNPFFYMALWIGLNFFIFFDIKITKSENTYLPDIKDPIAPITIPTDDIKLATTIVRAKFLSNT